MSEIDYVVSPKFQILTIWNFSLRYPDMSSFQPHSFRAEMDSPSGTYSDFPKVNVLDTVQHNELVRIATCHYFTFWVWKVYYKNYSPWPTYNILINFIWTFLAWDIKNLPRSPVYEWILEEARTLIWRNHISWSIANMNLKILHKVQREFLFIL